MRTADIAHQGRSLPVVVPGNDGWPGLPVRAPNGWSQDVISAFGVNVHPTYPWYTASKAKFYAAVLSLGVGWSRVGVYTNSNADVRAYVAAVTPKVEQYSVSGLKNSTDQGQIDGAVSEIKSYYGGAAGNSHGKFVGVSCQNETNPNTGTTYVAALKSWLAAMRSKFDAAGLTVPVSGAVLAFRSKNNQYTDVGDISAWTNIGDYHMYTGGHNPEFWFQGNGVADNSAGTIANAAVNGKGWDMVNLAHINTPRQDLWMTECGGHNCQNATNDDGTQQGHIWTPPEVLGVYGFRHVLGPVERGVKRVALYELVDQGNIRSTDMEAHFGIFNSDWTEKPFATSLRQAAAIYADSGIGTALAGIGIDFAPSAPPSDLRSMLHQRKDGSYLLALWRNVSIWDPAYGRSYAAGAITVSPATVAVRLDKKRDIAVYKPSSQAGPVSGLGGTKLADISLSLTAEPVILKLT